MSALVIVPPGFRPACMAPDEHEAWLRMNRRTATARAVAVARPCADCTLGYAAEMRAVGRCNGNPGGLEEEDPEMEEPIDVRLHRRLPVTLSPPPCASCVHEPVCALRATVEGLTEVPVAAPAMPDGLRITLTAAVECAHWLRDRTKPEPRVVLTPAQRGQLGLRASRRTSPEAAARMAAANRDRAAARRAAREQETAR